ncbi:hypothetical protein K7432_004733 [Basidiobolus ranarum]|uniref:Pentatricopeptide repeat-containing protein-mitochondrial domain-containing protein n=1 Tax=Basidiobolus ranarum TaxID=34480 RepID=A0ABR2W467_9FUNG
MSMNSAFRGISRIALQIPKRTLTSSALRQNQVQYIRPATRYGKSGFSSDPKSPLDAYNQKLQHNKNDFAEVMKVFNDMKVSDVKPDLKTYNLLIASCMRSGNQEKVLETLAEMKELGIAPTVSTYDSMLQESIRTVANIPFIMDLMEKDQIPLTQNSYEYLIHSMVWNKRLERALDIFDSMKERKIRPTETTYSHIINGCIDVDETKLAYDFLKDSEAKSMFIPRGTYIRTLYACARNQEDNVEELWRKVIGALRIKPLEGLCMEVLNYACKAGKPDLAAEVLTSLTQNKIPCKEQHFAPLFEAFISNKDWKSALSILDVMVNSRIVPEPTFMEPFKNAIEKNASDLDDAYMAIENLREEGKQVHISAFNTIVSACAHLGDVKRAFAAVTDAPKLGIQADVETYNAILEACSKSYNKEIAEKVYHEIKATGLKPNAETFFRLIAVSCQQSDYEDAFAYLEETKENNIVPPAAAYVLLVRKCARERDSRARIAMEEMEVFGYPVTNELKKYVETGGMAAAKMFTKRPRHFASGKIDL